MNENLNEIFKESTVPSSNRSRLNLKGRESFVNMKASEHFELAQRLEADASTGFTLGITVSHYEKAAEKGNILAQLRLADAYSKGELGLEKNEQQSYKYYQLAADQGSARAQHITADNYRIGKGVKQSNVEALKYYKLAADQNYAKSQHAVGNFLWMGLGGVNKSFDKAFEYYKLAADQGYARSQYSVGSCFKRGKGTEKSELNALKYYHLAAEQGFAAAQYELALYFEKSSFKSTELEFKGILEKAIDYYGRALKQGYQKDHIKQKIQECQRMLAAGWKKVAFVSIAPSKIEKNLESIFGIIERLGDISLFYRPDGFIPDPGAQKIDVQLYLQDHDLSTLKRIFDCHKCGPAFLDGYGFSWEEAQIIRGAMIDNPRFLFVCSVDDIECLILAFELLGYERQKDVLICSMEHPAHEKICACLFLGNKKHA